MGKILAGLGGCLLLLSSIRDIVTCRQIVENTYDKTS